MQSKEVVAKAKDLRAINQGKKLVFVSGNFNIVHPGHVRLINFARSCGDALVVGLLVDGEPSVAVPYELRAEALRSMAAVHDVVPLQANEVVSFIATLQPHAVVKGKEHELHDNPEREVVKSYGGHLIFSSGDIRFSVVDLIRREAEGRDQPRLRRNGEFATQHALQPERLNGIVTSYSGIRALVLGDLIIDEYIHCDPLGMSQEDPTIVVTPVHSQRFTGGAGIVAGHVASLGGSASLLSITGADETAEAAAHSLGAMSVAHELVRDTTRPTILKQRFRAAGKTLLRVSHLRAHDAGDEYATRLLHAVEARLPTTDVLIFSDFNYGCLPQPLVDAVTLRCREMRVPYVADSQASSRWVTSHDSRGQP